MIIAQFTESYRPVVNGVAVAVDLLVEELSRRHRVEVFAPRFSGHQDDGPVHRFPSYTWPGHRDYPLAFPFSAAIQRRFQQTCFDIIHTHSPFALGQTGLAWARRHGIPVVTTYHTLYVEYSHYARILPQPLVRRFLRGLSRRYCDACDMIAVPTEPVGALLRDYGVRRPIRVVPTGLKLLPPQPPDPLFPRRALGIPGDAPLVLYAGRLAREKNLELLIQAFARVAREMPDAWLLLAGSGPMEAQVRRMVRTAGVSGRAAFAGHVPPERMGMVYAAADVFAFASLTDTQGLVLTEAKAAGVPAVSVDAYGPGMVITDGVDGFLTPNHPDAFAAALLRILRDPKLRHILRSGALREACRFSIQATAASYECLYAGVLQSSK